MMYHRIRHYLKKSSSSYRYLYLGAVLLVVGLLFEFAPHPLITLTNAGFLASALAFIACCIDFNMMLWRLYHKRGDLRPLRLLLMLLSAFITMLCIGRVVGFATLFFKEFLAVASLVNIASGGLAVLLVVLARSGEEYLHSLPRMEELAAAANEASDARRMLHFRENMALEGMVVSRDFTIIEANAAAYRIWEYDPAKHELIGMRADQLIHDDDHRTVYQNVLNNVCEPYVVRAITKTGAVRHIQAVGTSFERRMNADNGVADVVRIANFRDVTEQRRYLTEMPNALNDSLVQEMNQLRSYFHRPTAPTADVQ